MVVVHSTDKKEKKRAGYNNGQQKKERQVQVERADKVPQKLNKCSNK